MESIKEEINGFFDDLLGDGTVASGFVNLSEVLAPLSAKERRMILQHLYGAIGEGVLQAVPLNRTEHKPFKLSTSDASGKPVRRTISDLIMRRSLDLDAWIQEQCRGARMQSMIKAGKVETTAERIRLGTDDFDTLADLTRLKFGSPALPSKKTKRARVLKK